VDKQQETSLLESIATMAKALSVEADVAPIKQVPLAKYKAQTPWNPEGKPEHVRPKLRRTVYLSNRRLSESFLSDEEITLLNRIKAGKYNERRWVVVETDGEADGSAISIIIPNKTPEDRMRLKGEAPDIATVLRRIIAEQEANEASTPSRKAKDEPGTL